MKKRYRLTPAGWVWISYFAFIAVMILWITGAFN